MFFHIGHEIDGRWAKGPFKTFDNALASLDEFAPHGEPITHTGVISYSDIGGRHSVEEFNETFKTAESVEDYLDAYDARECGRMTQRQRLILLKHYR